MTLRADYDELVKAAAGWDGVGEELRIARAIALNGEGNGSAFGYLACKAHIGTQHDTFLASMTDALAQGERRMQTIADLLRKAARDFGATDLHVRDTFHHLDGTPR
jgi:hypothetical protein